MNKQRLEAFTDGVYAIVITLLILNIRIPEVKAEVLEPALIGILPQVFTYVLSFFVMGCIGFRIIVSHSRSNSSMGRLCG